VIERVQVARARGHYRVEGTPPAPPMLTASRARLRGDGRLCGSIAEWRRACGARLGHLGGETQVP
jgi:hypothetical protein